MQPTMQPMMQIETIFEGNLSRYLPYLSNQEIFAVRDGRYSGFGAYDESKDAVLGVLVVQILPAYIRIHRLQAAPEYQDCGAEKELLGIIMVQPEGAQLPIFYVSEDPEQEAALLAWGFVRGKGEYTYFEGTVGDLRHMEMPPKKHRVAVQTLDRVSVRELGNFIFGKEYDQFLQIPELALDMERFSDGSLVCLLDGKIDAVILLEELDQSVDVSYIHAKNAKSLLYLFPVLRRALQTEYSLQAKIRFLLCGGVGREALGRILEHGKEQPVYIYQLELEKDG